MSGAKFTDEFKRDAVAQVVDRGYLPADHRLETRLRGESAGHGGATVAERPLVRDLLEGFRQRPTAPFLHPNLPAGFDPEIYLLRNPDIRGADVDPVVHFLSVGAKENRPWRLRRDPVSAWPVWQ